MSTEVPSNFLAGSHVVVPLTFFKELLACYYGTGPRFGESRTPTPPVTPAPSPAVEMGGVSPTVPLPVSSMRLTPMGAARPKEPVHEPRTKQAAEK